MCVWASWGTSTHLKVGEVFLSRQNILTSFSKYIVLTMRFQVENENYETPVEHDILSFFPPRTVKHLFPLDFLHL